MEGGVLETLWFLSFRHLDAPFVLGPQALSKRTIASFKLIKRELLEHFSAVVTAPADRARD